MASCNVCLADTSRASTPHPPHPPHFSLPSLTVVVTLQQADPRKMFPELKDSLMDNLKSLKKTMTDADWKVSACYHPTLPLLGAPRFGEGLGCPHLEKQSCLSQAWVTPTPRKVVVLATFLGPRWSLRHSSPHGAPPAPCWLTRWFLLLQSFESWMHKWLLFEMAKNPKPEDRKAIPAEKGIREGGC